MGEPLIKGVVRALVALRVLLERRLPLQVGCRRVQGVGCRVQGVGCRVQGVGCRVQGVGCKVTEEPLPPPVD